MNALVGYEQKYCIETRTVPRAIAGLGADRAAGLEKRIESLTIEQKLSF